MIPCRRATELLSQGQDRPLGLRERIQLWLHLRICTGCRATQGHFRFLREALGQHPARLPRDPDEPKDPTT